ncbi:hypothetical protein EMIT0P43_30128 [Pseudomonas jessenii]
MTRIHLTCLNAFEQTHAATLILIAINQAYFLLSFEGASEASGWLPIRSKNFIMKRVAMTLACSKSLFGRILCWV